MSTMKRKRKLNSTLDGSKYYWYLRPENIVHSYMAVRRACYMYVCGYV